MVTGDSERKLFEKGDIALFLAPFTAFCYGLAFIQKVGKYNYYGIPTQLIELGINSLTVTILSIFPLVVFTFFYFYKMFIKIKENQARHDQVEEPVQKYKILKKVVGIIVLGIFFLWFSYFTVKFWGNLSLFITISGFITPIVVLFIFRYYKKRKFIHSLLLGAIFMMFLSYSMGIGSSALESNYTIVKEKKKIYIVLDSYDKKLILAPVNLKKRTYKKEFIIRDISDKDYTISTKMIILKMN